ncbi:MAG: hypothetical protein HOF94_03935 [Alphaproteobacteria bacterium]|jgi:hypothetical protein|nr:hypothetical protein [Alphaproteobacteria bacterium]
MWEQMMDVAFLALALFVVVLSPGIAVALTIWLITVVENRTPHVISSHSIKPLTKGVSVVVCIVLIIIYSGVAVFTGIKGALASGYSMQLLIFVPVLVVLLMCTLGHLLLVKIKKQKFAHYTIALIIIVEIPKEIFSDGVIGNSLIAIINLWNTPHLMDRLLSILLGFIYQSLLCAALAGIFWLIAIKDNPRYDLPATTQKSK